MAVWTLRGCAGFAWLCVCMRGDESALLALLARRHIGGVSAQL